jgi:hypothetical protein
MLRPSADFLDLREISDPNGGGWQRRAAVGRHDRSTSRWCGATALLSLRPRARRAAARGCPQAPAGLLQLGTRAIGSAPPSPPKVRAHLSSHSHSHCWRRLTSSACAARRVGASAERSRAARRAESSGAAPSRGTPGSAAVRPRGPAPREAHGGRAAVGWQLGVSTRLRLVGSSERPDERISRCRCQGRPRASELAAEG